MNQDLPASADLLLVGGSHDTRVASWAGEVARTHSFGVIVVSGGAGKITADVFTRPEAEVFADTLAANGVDMSKVLLERAARHSGENITLSRRVLLDRGIEVHEGVLVTKPYMERRFWSTASKQWPEVRWTVTSPPLSIDEYPTAEVPERRMIELMVGDCQRLKIYAESGLQVPQEIPQEVWSAYDFLVASGYDAHVIG